jgi:predicted thioesterase
MINPFHTGDQRTYSKVVSSDDLATFESGTVHEVYSTFALTRDAEWSGRLFVLEMKESEEEGIGTSISVEHKGPAFEGDTIRFVSTFLRISDRGEILTSYQAFSGERLIAEGLQGQRILTKKKIESIFESLKK